MNGESPPIAHVADGRGVIDSWVGIQESVCDFKQGPRDECGQNDCAEIPLRGGPCAEDAPDGLLFPTGLPKGKPERDSKRDGSQREIVEALCLDQLEVDPEEVDGPSRENIAGDEGNRREV